MSLSRIYYIIDKLNSFTKEDANIKPPEYTTLPGKINFGQLKKNIFQVVNLKENPNDK